MQFVVFAVLALECIFLVSSAKDGETYFNEYNKMYKQCRALSSLEPDVKMPESSLAMIDFRCDINPKLTLFVKELIAEIECFNWIRKQKVEDNFKKLKTLFHLIYLANYYTCITTRQSTLYNIEAMKTKLLPEKEKLYDDLRLISTLLVIFVKNSAFMEILREITQIRKNDLNSLDNDQAETPMQIQVEIIDEDEYALNTLLMETMNVEVELVKRNYDRANEGQKPEPLGKNTNISEKALSSTNSIMNRLLPGCDLPKQLSEYLNDNENINLLSNVRSSGALNPNEEFKEESRIIKIIQTLVSSDYEKGIISTPTSASASASASSSTPTSEQ